MVLYLVYVVMMLWGICNSTEYMLGMLVLALNIYYYKLVFSFFVVVAIILCFDIKTLMWLGFDAWSILFCVLFLLVSILMLLALKKFSFKQLFLILIRVHVIYFVISVLLHNNFLFVLGNWNIETSGTYPELELLLGIRNYFLSIIPKKITIPVLSLVFSMTLDGFYEPHYKLGKKDIMLWEEGKGGLAKSGNIMNYGRIDRVTGPLSNKLVNHMCVLYKDILVHYTKALKSLDLSGKLEKTQQPIKLGDKVCAPNTLARLSVDKYWTLAKYNEHTKNMLLEKPDILKWEQYMVVTRLNPQVSVYIGPLNPEFYFHVKLINSNLLRIEKIYLHSMQYKPISQLKFYNYVKGLGISDFYKFYGYLDDSKVLSIIEEIDQVEILDSECIKIVNYYKYITENHMKREAAKFR